MFPVNLDEEMVVVYIDSSKGGNPEVPVHDPRANKPIGCHDQQDDETAFFQRLITTKIDDTEISLAAPNEIAISLHISKKSVEQSDMLRLLIKKKGKETDSAIYESDVAIAYDYLEEIQKAVVFSYKAVESFCNAVIPDDYTYIKTTSKGIEEHYRKEQIERWLSTSEKVLSILPEIMNVSSPSQEVFWSGFKNLERIRNEIIHSKSSSSTKILKELFSEKMRDYVVSSLDLLNFFIKADPFNQVFPLGFGESKIKVFSVENAHDIFKKVE